MTLINISKLIFAGVFFAEVLTSLFTLPEQLSAKDVSSIDQGEKDSVREDRWEKRIRKSLEGLMIFGVLVCSLLLVFRFKRYTWILLFFSLATYLEYIVNTYQSVSVLKNIVTSNEGQILSRRENNALIFVSSFLCMLSMMQIPENAIELVTTCKNDILTDVLICIFYVLLIFAYLFLSFVFLPKIIYNFSYLFKKQSEKKQKSVWKNFRDYFLYCRFGQKRPEELTIYLIKFIRGKARLCWKIGYIFIPLIYVVDVGALLIWSVYATLCRIIGYSLCLFILLKNSFLKGILWMLQLTTKSAVAIIFRVSIILTLVLVVAWNRYQPFFRLSDASTAVFEFIASAIIIPVMFEWIISARC